MTDDEADAKPKAPAAAAKKTFAGMHVELFLCSAPFPVHVE